MKTQNDNIQQPTADSHDQTDYQQRKESIVWLHQNVTCLARMDLHRRKWLRMAGLAAVVPGITALTVCTGAVRVGRITLWLCAGWVIWLLVCLSFYFVYRLRMAILLVDSHNRVESIRKELNNERKDDQ